MLETIQEYGFEQLVAHDELEAMRKRHANYFAALAERADTERKTDPVRWLNVLEREITNFRAALTSHETGLRLAVALGTFWQQRAHLSEASAWLTDALAQQYSGMLTAADRTLRARALFWLGTFRSWQGDLDTAEPPHEESVVLFRELGDRAGLAEALSTYGILFVMRGDHERAAPVLEESLAVSRELRNTWHIAQSILFLGILAYSQGYIQQASTLWEESLALHRADANTWLIGIVLAFLAMAALEQSDHARAKDQLIESLTLLRELGEKWQTAHTLEVFACLAVAQAQPSPIRAAHIFGAAEVFRETLSAPVLPFQRHFNERGVAALRAQLDDSALAAAWAEGRAMTLEQVVAYALET
jgi:tetratricopeptide (TPR) repeat protein